MGKIFLILFYLVLINSLTIIGVSALCEDGQIDINSASLEELDKLSGIGPVKAQAIIDTRPFQSVDNLIDVSGIGEVTLVNIKTQGLACVADEEKPEEDSEEEENEIEEAEEQESEDEEKEENEEEEIEEEETPKIINNLEQTKITEEEVKTIILSPKDIKSESNKEGVSKNKFAIYGLVVFCILLVFLFGVRKVKNEKTEFK